MTKESQDDLTNSSFTVSEWVCVAQIHCREVTPRTWSFVITSPRHNNRVGGFFPWMYRAALWVLFIYVRAERQSKSTLALQLHLHFYFFPQSRHQMLSSNSESYALWYGNIDICIPRWFPIKLFPDDLTGEELSAPQSNFLRDFS